MSDIVYDPGELQVLIIDEIDGVSEVSTFVSQNGHVESVYYYNMCIGDSLVD